MIREAYNNIILYLTGGWNASSDMAGQQHQKLGPRLQGHRQILKPSPSVVKFISLF